MKESEEFKQLIFNANEDDLLDIVLGWAEKHSDFRAYVKHCLVPPIEEVDFCYKLRQAINRETKEFFSRHEVRDVTDWSNIYYELIELWSKNADSLTTDKLYDLIYAIITEVGMQITDSDFYGDDWYGDDFSGSIQDIMDVLGNLTGLLLIRDDLSSDILDSLKELIIAARKKDVIRHYIDSPYDFMLDMVKLRQDSEKVSLGLFDEMIENNFGNEAGEWVCRKIDFIRSMGLVDEAQKYMEEEIRFPQVCLKYYGELLDDGNWQDAIKLLDKAQSFKDNQENYYYYKSPNWLELKQQLLSVYGTLQDRIENLKRLFYNSNNDKSNYYHKLKELVDADSWKTFYQSLLSNVKGYNVIDEISEFLIEESEFDWLYRLVSKKVKKDATDYRTPLKYAEALRTTHFGEMQAMLVRTVVAYAADEFAPKKKVNTDEYSYLRAHLETLSKIGYAETLKEIVEYLKKEYKFRPSLFKEMSAIKLK